MTRFLTMTILIAIATIAVACSNGDPAPNDVLEDGRQADGVDSTGAGDGVAVDVLGGDEPLFVYTGAETLGGDEVTFGQVFSAGKPVVLNFWAGLCPPCRQEMPDFQEVYSERNDEFLLVGVDVGPFTGLGNEADALALLDELGITYPTARVESNSMMREYNVFGMPTTVFLTADGTIVSQKGGFITAGEFRDRLQEMIDASS